MIAHYIRYITKSTNQHGVHSPFVYQLVIKCFYVKSKRKNIKIYKKNKNDIKSINKIITITDFGSGSRIFKNNQRKVSDLVDKVGISTKRALLINRMTDYLNISNALELGTSIGLATTAMCIKNSKVKVDTIEGCPEILKVAKNQFSKMGIEKQVTTYCGDFKNVLPKLTSSKKYDLIYFDGNHQKEATINYFEECLKSKHNDSVFIFDDIYWSDGMEQAWSYIKNHKEVTVSIDLFKWGLVFFRKEQVKEHFKIRF